MSIADNLRQVRDTIPPHVTLVAVSKYHPAESIRQAYDAGQRLFAESRVQELLAKQPQLPDDIHWHFIGHLQTNKVRHLIGHTTLIESVDTIRLLNLIDAESYNAGIITRVLLQIHIAAEETKFGFSPTDLLDYFNTRQFENLRATHICGLMAMATNTDDDSRIAADFNQAARLFDTIRATPGLIGFDTLSMGMSDDRRQAIAAGSTMVRVGTAIFGPRQY